MNLHKRRILIVSSEFPPQPGGIGNHALNLAKYLSKEGFVVRVIADQRSKNGDAELEFDDKLPFRITRIGIKKWRLFMYLNRLVTTFKLLRTSDYVLATGKFSLWNVAFCNIFFRCHSIAVIHGSEVNFKPFILRKSIDISLKKFRHIVAVSNYTKNLVSHLTKQVQIIPNGIDSTKWKIDNSNTISLKGNPSLITVGRVSTRKGQLNVIKQLPILVKHFPELHYHCIGIPTEAESFITIARELKVENHVTFHGSVDDNKLKALLNDADIFVMLSTESDTGDVEGFGIAILEANVLGIPAIGSINCGIEDAIHHKVSGELINSEDTMSFKVSIDNILKAKSDYETGARNWAKSHDWSFIIKRYLDLLE